LQYSKGFTPARRARVAAKAAALREEMTLEELRKARDLSQEEIAQVLAVGQPAVAKLEKRTDMHISNPRRCHLPRSSAGLSRPRPGRDGGP